MLVKEYILSDLARVLPFPKKDVNKYSRGKLTIVGGSAAYPGAASLSAMSAQSMGAGYVEVLCAPESVNTIRCTRPSLVVKPWNDQSAFNTFLDFDDDSTKKPSKNPEAYLVGPGIDSKDSYSQNLVYKVLENSPFPVVVDGGALSALSTVQGLKAASDRMWRKCQTILTPHLGEASQLAIQARIEVPSPNSAESTLAKFAQSLAKKYASTVVLKGPITFVASPRTGDDKIYVVRQGTSALAKAGTGDVLAGMIGALFAQDTDVLRNDAVKACVLAATLHAYSGRLAGEKKTDISVFAEDVVDNIPNAIRYIMEFV